MSSRSLLVKQLPCIACEKDKQRQPNRTEEHHLNTGGNAGQRRRGDEFSIPLCQWHHRGEMRQNRWPRVERAAEWESAYGPSLARNSKEFRTRYGTDDELLQLTNERLASL